MVRQPCLMLLTMVMLSVWELLKADTDLHINETASMGASLIDAGADVNIKNDLKNTALSIAAMVGDVEYLNMMIAVANKMKCTPWWSLDEEDMLNVWRSWLQQELMSTNRTALVFAAKNLHTYCVKELLQSGANFRQSWWLRKAASWCRSWCEYQRW